jgi:RNA polymerase sigma-70 factor (ECF subfamily)
LEEHEFIESALSHLDALYRHAFTCLGDAPDAEDVVQETYLRAYKSRQTFRGQSQLKTWLTRIMLRVVADHLRKSKRRIVTLNLEESLDVDVSGPTVAGPEDIICANEKVERIRTALNLIPDEFARPLLLREFHDATYFEISNILEIPEGTVMSRLSRARSMLRKILLDDVATKVGEEVKCERFQS